MINARLTVHDKTGGRGALLEIEGINILIDLGRSASFYKKLFEEKSPRCILITHTHKDHFNPPAVKYICNWVKVAGIEIICNKGTAAAIEKLASDMTDSIVVLSGEGEEHKLCHSKGNLYIGAFGVVHDIPTLAFVFSYISNDGKIWAGLYATDCGPETVFPQKKFDAVYLEAAHSKYCYDNNQFARATRVHLSREDSMIISKSLLRPGGVRVGLHLSKRHAFKPKKGKKK